MSEVRVYADLPALSAAAAQDIWDLAQEAVAHRGRFSLVLSGGATPEALYRELAAEPMGSSMPWSRTHLLWGDERCLPPDHGQSNFNLARRTLLSGVRIPSQNIHRIPAELGAEAGAEAYARELRYLFRDQGEERFDLVLLGLGADGHTASLFPGTAKTSGGLTAAVRGPGAEPAVDRVSLTPAAINLARTAFFLVSGANKARALDRVLNDPQGSLPAAMVRPERLVWFVDRAAAGIRPRAAPGP
ncbi:MAG: 6-phosphogluconolactonase [Desulfovibrionaceae bacterium]|nr:6-phosphogluconolactonase [Desulfovibrionaceae bacterium]